jgi:hypothetical protein
MTKSLNQSLLIKTTHTELRFHLPGGVAMMLVTKRAIARRYIFAVDETKKALR